MIFDFGRVGVSKLRPYIYRMKKLKYILDDLRFLKALNSPFKPFKVKLYAGKTRIGIPYFFPRKWVKATPERAHKAVLDYIAREESYNKMNPDYARKIRPYDEVFKEKMRYDYAVDKKVGFDFVGLGWKTKWEWNDYRFEWNPVWSFVFFKWQIALIFAPKEDESHYWECWLAYSRDTDKTKSTKERIEQAKKDFPCIWSSYKDGVKTTICYWDKVLKKK